MLKPHEFTAGWLENAAHMTFVLPRTSYEQRALVLSIDSKPHALLLEGDERTLHHVAACREEASWGGVLIPSVEIEIDPTSVYIDGSYPPLGALVRLGTCLSVQTRFLGRNPGFGSAAFQLLDNLPLCEGSERASFTRWSIVLGEGQAKRVLHQVDVARE